MSYADEDQRNDAELTAAVIAKLVKHREDLISAMALMNEAYNILAQTDDLHDGWGHSPHHVKARRNLAADYERLSWFVKHILSNVESEHSAYAGNIAAFLNSAKAAKLKKNYREGKI